MWRDSVDCIIGWRSRYVCHFKCDIPGFYQFSGLSGIGKPKKESPVYLFQVNKHGLLGNFGLYGFLRWETCGNWNARLKTQRTFWHFIPLAARPPRAYYLVAPPHTKMTFYTTSFLFSLVGLAIATAIPRGDSITALSASQVAAFKPFSYYAATGYCKPAAVLNKSCGGEHQSLHSLVNTSLIILKLIAMQTARSNPLRLVGMVCIYSFGMLVSTPAWMYAHLSASNN